MSQARSTDGQISVETMIPGTPQRGAVLERGLLIGGNSVPASSGKFADDISPWDGEIYARVAAGTPEDITRAADAAQAAFPSWSKVGAFERREIFLRAADVMAKRGEEAITALARETGASRVFSEFNLAFCIQVLREVRHPLADRFFTPQNSPPLLIHYHQDPANEVLPAGGCEQPQHRQGSDVRSCSCGERPSGCQDHSRCR
jgi:hypothetical protein